MSAPASDVVLHVPNGALPVAGESLVNAMVAIAALAPKPLVPTVSMISVVFYVDLDAVREGLLQIGVAMQEFKKRTGTAPLLTTVRSMFGNPTELAAISMHLLRCCQRVCIEGCYTGPPSAVTIDFPAGSQLFALDNKGEGISTVVLRDLPPTMTALHVTANARVHLLRSQVRGALCAP